MAKNKSNKDIKDIANYARFQMNMTKIALILVAVGILFIILLGLTGSVKFFGP